MEESCGAEGKEQVYKALNGQLVNMDLDLQREATRLITLLTDKVPDACGSGLPGRRGAVLTRAALSLCRCSLSFGGTSSTSACLQTPSTMTT